MFEHGSYIICRLCRKSCDSFVDIYNPKGTRGLIVWKVMKDLIQLDVSMDDTLPNTICDQCMDKIVEFRNFKTMCINSRIEFLKASVNVGLVENEVVTSRGPSVRGGATATCANVAYGDPLEWRPLPFKGATVDKLQIEKCPPNPAPQLSPEDEDEDVSTKYLEPRLDEGIGTLKACDAPNCRKVFSSFKALVVHKNDKHANLIASNSSDEKGYILSNTVSDEGNISSADPVDQPKYFGRVCIEEFVCEYPSCEMKFSNLSLLLSHQVSHSPTKDALGGVGSIKEDNLVDADDDIEFLEEVDIANGGYNTTEGLPVEESHGDGSFMHVRDTSGGNQYAALPSGDAVMAETSRGVPESSIPEELEYLCHHPGCGETFDSYDSLQKHKKQRHKVVETREIRKQKMAVNELKRLRIDMVERESYEEKPRHKSVSKKVKRSRNDPPATVVSHAEEIRERTDNTVPRSAILSGDVADSSAVVCLCPWSDCHLRFDSSKELHRHQAQVQHGCRKKEDCTMPDSTSSQAGTVKISNVSVPPRSGFNVRQCVGAAKLKTKRKTFAQPAVEEESFECQIPSCPETFKSFMDLVAHVSQRHQGSCGGKEGKRRGKSVGRVKGTKTKRGGKCPS